MKNFELPIIQDNKKGASGTSPERKNTKPKEKIKWQSEK